MYHLPIVLFYNILALQLLLRLKINRRQEIYYCCSCCRWANIKYCLARMKELNIILFVINRSCKDVVSRKACLMVYHACFLQTHVIKVLSLLHDHVYHVPSPGTNHVCWRLQSMKCNNRVQAHFNLYLKSSFQVHTLNFIISLFSFSNLLY